MQVDKEASDHIDQLQAALKDASSRERLLAALPAAAGERRMVIFDVLAEQTDERTQLAMAQLVARATPGTEADWENCSSVGVRPP